MKRKYKAVCRIELHDLAENNYFMELLKFHTNKIKINGKDYYIEKIDSDCVSFIEFGESEHEIEIGDSIFKN